MEPDGIDFDVATIEAERIAEDADYEGIRVRFRGSLDTARIVMQLDIGFGDVVIPSPEPTNYPTLLDLPAPRLRGYSRESTIAEKFEAMVKLGILNSRMKDFFDIWLMSRQFDFKGATLAEAVSKTFSTRGTKIQSEPIALTDSFAEDAAKAAQWRGFMRRNRLEDVPEGSCGSGYVHRCLPQTNFGTSGSGHAFSKQSGKRRDHGANDGGNRST